ncbi:MAG: YihY/virulence factor BrkB family protein [Pseudomonadota bacterium]
MTPSQFFSLVRKALITWSEDYAPSMGAALSYYTLFSIAPLLVIVIATAGIFFGEEAVRGEIFVQLAGLLGEEGAQAVESLLQSAPTPEDGMLAALVSLAVLVLGATTVLGELQSDLDRIWRVPMQQKLSGLWSYARSRILSFTMILCIAFILMVSLALSAVIAILGKWWGAWFIGWEVLAHVLDLAVSFGLMTLLFALIYKIVPRARIRWRDVWVGAAFTALLFSVGKILIGLYLGKSDVTSAFGAAGSLVLLMVWVYYSAQIFLIGAEFTWVYAHEYGSRRGVVVPAAPATPTVASISEARAPHKPDEVLAPRGR